MWQLVAVHPLFLEHVSGSGHYIFQNPPVQTLMVSDRMSEVVGVRSRGRFDMFVRLFWWTVLREHHEHTSI